MAHSYMVFLITGVCSVWGESHYMTFDGKSYDFSENCTFYLVKEIIPKYNLTIILTINGCDDTNGESCAKSLLVAYQTYGIVLTQFKTSRTTTNQVSTHSTCQDILGVIH